MAELRLADVTKVFSDGDEEIRAVDGIPIDIRDGEFLVLVGPSGCGKSTTLRMIAGLESVTSGTIELSGEVIDDVKPQERDTAMVFQSYALYPHLTVQENMSFGLEESTDLPDDEIRERIEETAEMMGIDDLLDRKPRDLSGGQQQRVALGRAIVRDPKVFLMDEPLSNLDAKLRAQMRTELQRLQKELGVTTIYVTHDQTEAMTMGDRIAILNDGELQQVGTPLECYHEPQNQFVAGFLGEPSMNFIETSLKDGSLVGDSFEYPLSPETLTEVESAQRISLGIRPDDIQLSDESTSERCFKMTIDIVEPMGDNNNITLRYADDEARTITAITDGIDTYEMGETVFAELPENRIHLFDLETGRTLKNRRLKGESPPTV